MITIVSELRRILFSVYWVAIEALLSTTELALEKGTPDSPQELASNIYALKSVSRLFDTDSHKPT